MKKVVIIFGLISGLISSALMFLTLPLIKNVIPGMQSPTVMPLADPAMIAVHAVVDTDAVWALLGPLKAAGATSILVMPIEKLIP